ncbi:MAG: hypothetical protein ABIV50_06345 [Opitutus sp.]
MANGTKRTSLLEEMVGWEFAAFLGLLTYLCTIAFEHGVALYWGFPSELITFTLEKAFGAFLPAIGCSLLAVIVLEVITDRTANKALKILFGVCVSVLIGFAVYGLVRLAKAEHANGSSLLGACFLLAILVLGALYAPTERTPKVPRPLLAYLLMICTLPWGAFGIGYVLESTRTHFMVIEGDGQRLVVLRAYGSTAVCTALPATLVLGDRFRVENLAANAALTFHREALKLTPISEQQAPR